MGDILTVAIGGLIVAVGVGAWARWLRRTRTTANAVRYVPKVALWIWSISSALSLFGLFKSRAATTTDEAIHWASLALDTAGIGAMLLCLMTLGLLVMTALAKRKQD